MKQVGPYKFTKRIGKGHYASVFKAINHENDQIVAVKCLQRHGISANQIKNIENEVLVLQKSNHPSIVSMLDRMRSKSQFYLVLEYCNGGDLSSFVQIVGKLPEDICRLIIMQIIEGMMHLHSLHVLHRDLKLANVLLHFPDMEGREDMINNDWLRKVDLKTTNFQIKIADLGFSKIQQDPDDLSVTYCGTPINMAPEVLNRGVYNYKADVWSLGTILFELLTGKSPFKAAQNKEELKKCHRNVVISNPKDLLFSKECLRFINLCLTYNQYKRPSWRELLDHNFIRLPKQQQSDKMFSLDQILPIENLMHKHMKIKEIKNASDTIPVNSNPFFDQQEENINEIINDQKTDYKHLKYSSAHKNPFNDHMKSQQNYPIDQTIGKSRLDSKSIDSQELQKIKDEDDDEWNVDVSSEELDKGILSKQFKNKGKKRKIDLFLSCRNIVIKSASQINENYQGSSSDSFQNNQALSPQGFYSKNFLSNESQQNSANQPNKQHPQKGNRYSFFQKNQDQNQFSVQQNDSGSESELENDVNQDEGSLKMPSQFNKFSTTESPFSVKSSDHAIKDSNIEESHRLDSNQSEKKSYKMSTSKAQSSQSLSFSRQQKQDFSQNYLKRKKSFAYRKSKFYYLSIQNSCKSLDEITENNSNQYNVNIRDDSVEE